ncbi:MAG: 5-(carboxyamino)imidazole ribonucleotide synthase [Candidatus Ancillula sp.]|jgi:5-(carboxyamino)imidazole ribonucleotide synthase|nr:5-(carboxyamino)imidazole ribonucleotide synthase [Candidatus Ancillula sp.]
MRLGVVGGGQLARMMAPSSQELSVNMRILVEELGSSAEQVFSDCVLGDYNDINTLRMLAYGLNHKSVKKVDALTFEHEFMPNRLIKQIEDEGFRVAPSSKALFFAQDKIAMRKKMDSISQVNANIRNPKYEVVQNQKQLQQFFDYNQFREVAVKAPSGGYDGKGVEFIDSANSDKAHEWLKNFDQILVEERVSFVCEVSALVARSESEIVAYDVVESIQENGVCRTVIAPAPKLNEAQRQTAQEIAKTIADELDVQGILAVEMFFDGEGFLINELAMRPHNTGHWSINGAVTSQFENHIRAVLGLPLGSTRMLSKCVVMRNILGSEYEDMSTVLDAALKVDKEAKINLYGKATRAGRKLGHVNIIGEDFEKLTQTAQKIVEILEGVDYTSE